MNSKVKGPDKAGIVIAAALAGLAGVIWWDATKLSALSPYGLGPDAAPKVVAAGLAVLAVANFVNAWRGAMPHREPGDLGAILWIVGGLAALIAIIAFGGGFIIATAVLFAATARAFGRRALLVDFGIGVGLGLVAYLLFAKLLSLTLPTGPLEQLI
ncbi:tripartite tricarboxylate transporter TctB family protein [Aquabacter sp. P-9]|uniref:tripartite tricarboxylate transporter TctB family protein n=1 Tax=Aquabacter sediminis TaxID=3029197 RepID=UPI00237D939C|nr:tripartite tricarboxylate transporter TctB family protein [Aquabacter sp. P-9]MDE1568219.1 tripartite tricarboxylate transporter TctB family protein [Aquabacter sp. P-9]